MPSRLPRWLFLALFLLALASISGGVVKSIIKPADEHVYQKWVPVAPQPEPVVPLDPVEFP